MKIIILSVIVFEIFMSSASARMRQAPPPNGQLVNKEPAYLAFGQTVLIDDKSCPRGQIKQVTGGYEYRNIPKTTECIVRGKN